MTPGARISAAIDVIDAILDGAAAEPALQAWARGSRFAGSKDRAAVRDHVFDVLRQKASLGAATGRGLLIALARREGWDTDTLFTGERHAPAPIAPGEGATAALSEADRHDIPGWLWDAWCDSLGDTARDAAIAQQARAALYLRVNLRKATQDQAMAALASEDIATAPHDTVATCLQVTTNARRVKLSKAYADGLVEVQDAASQAAIARIAVPAGGTVLDYCAGGGGKALAVAAAHDCTVSAFDLSWARMQDITPRAARAGVAISLLRDSDIDHAAGYDVVLCDTPCSGSGTWRRTPDAKWQLTPEKLSQYNVMQREVLVKSAACVKAGGLLAYMTCSVLRAENEAIVADFLDAALGWKRDDTMRLVPCHSHDGFFLATFLKS